MAGIDAPGRRGRGWTVKRISEQPIEPSDCGHRRRIFSRDDDSPAAFLHEVRIREARPHYHRKAHEYYYVLEGEGAMVLDGEEVQLLPGTCIEIRPGTVHSARGDVLVLVIGVPRIDDDDVLFPPVSVERA